MKPILGKTIWITGASSGLGRALAIEFAKAGNFVIASARSKIALAELATLYPANIKALPMNVSKELDLVQTAAQLNDITDFIDMVICAAGIAEYEDNLSFNPSLYEETMDINFIGVVRAFHLALPLLKKSQSKPHFIAISSLSSCVGLPRAEAYGASKAALNYFMQSLKADLINLPIDFSLVRPGFIATKLVQQNDFSMPYLMTPEEASQQVMLGISQRKFMIDFPRRLSWPLRLGAVFFTLWCKWIAPRITRIHSW